MKNNYESASDLLEKEPTKPLPRDVGEARIARLERMRRDYEEDLNPAGIKLLDRSISATKDEMTNVPKTPSEMLSRPTVEVTKAEAAAELERLQSIEHQGVPGVMYANGLKLLKRVIDVRKKQAG